LNLAVDLHDGIPFTLSGFDKEACLAHSRVIRDGGTVRFWVGF